MMTTTEFAKAAKTAASNVGEMGRFGRKATISSVWAEMEVEMTLEAFKAQLIEAHRAGLLVLSRLDMPGVFPKTVVARSSVKYMGIAEFHLMSV